MVGIMTWDRREAGQPWIRWIRSALAAGECVPDHRHDFAEFNWVLEGAVVHRRLGGEDEILRPGACRFFAPGDGHRLTGADGGGALVSASLPGPLFAELHARYAGSAGWPWLADGEPRRWQLEPAGIEALQGIIAAVPQQDQERADAEWFAASLVRVLRRPVVRSVIPAWLAQAVRAIPTKEGLLDGLDGLVRRTGRNPATVSRAVRRYYGCTASALVLQARVEHAGQALRLDGSPILDIAMACGFKDLGHFYRAFRARYGMSPGSWRGGVEVTRSGAAGARRSPRG